MLTTKGLSILAHGIISLTEATSCDKIKSFSGNALQNHQKDLLRFIQTSLFKIQGLFKDFLETPTVFKDYALSVHVIIFEPVCLDSSLPCTGYFKYTRPPPENYFSYFSTKTDVVGAQKNCLDETVLLSTQNICLN